MPKNMGTLDRAVRALFAAVVALLYATNVISGTVGIVLVVLGVVFLLTSLIGFCPLYAPFKFSTLKR